MLRVFFDCKHIYNGCSWPLSMGVDPQKKVQGTPPLPPLPLELGPLNPARRSGGAL